MGVLYVSFGSKVRPRTVRYVALGSAVLFIYLFILFYFIHTQWYIHILILTY